MKAKDIEVGKDYALDRGEWRSALRMRVLDAPGRWASTGRWSDKLIEVTPEKSYYKVAAARAVKAAHVRSNGTLGSPEVVQLRQLSMPWEEHERVTKEREALEAERRATREALNTASRTLYEKVQARAAAVGVKLGEYDLNQRDSHNPRVELRLEDLVKLMGGVE